MVTPLNFTASAPRPMPVIILADTSGSMARNGNINALNTALRDLIETFAAEEPGLAEVHVAIITFGGEAKLNLALAPAHQVTLRPLVALGKTPLGAAFELARTLIEDRDVVPSRAYSPAIVLLSDGVPTDQWEDPLRALLASGRASKAQRLALGIGADADAVPLRAFLGDPTAKVYAAKDANQIRSFFRWVTMSVQARSRSATPNSHGPTSVNQVPDEWEDIDYL